MSTTDRETRTLFEAEAFGAAERAQSHARALEATLAELEHGAGGDAELVRQVERLREFHRLGAVRLASIARQLGEGGAP